jgi:hypothetical protein
VKFELYSDIWRAPHLWCGPPLGLWITIACSEQSIGRMHHSGQSSLGPQLLLGYKPILLIAAPGDRLCALGDKRGGLAGLANIIGGSLHCTANVPHPPTTGTQTQSQAIEYNSAQESNAVWVEVRRAFGISWGCCLKSGDQLCNSFCQIPGRPDPEV